MQAIFRAVSCGIRRGPRAPFAVAAVVLKESFIPRGRIAHFAFSRKSLLVVRVVRVSLLVLRVRVDREGLF